MHGVLVFAWGAGVAVCVRFAATDSAVNLRHPAVTLSATLTVAWMLLAWSCMLSRSRLARLAWSLGFAQLLLHLVLAFGWAHDWSHGAAVEHVREVGGTGAGIAVNYLFAVVWFVDVLWWWVNPTGHANRPHWVGWLIHGFLAFVVLNATVMFGPPERRWWYAAVLAALAVVWWRTRRVSDGVV